MSIMKGRKLLNYIYCGVDFGDNVLEEFLDVNDNSDEKKKRIKRSFCLARGRLVSIKILIVLGWHEKKILKYAQKHKDYNIASKKFGVECWSLHSSEVVAL